jgi:hypothetical protein
MAATGFTPVSLYYSATASNVPLAANLVAGELAMNTADGKLFFKDSSGVVQTMASKATGSIGGSTTQIQFNNAGALGGSASLTWNGTVLTSSGFSGPLNGTVGATTPATGAFTTVTATGGVDKLTTASGVVSVAASSAPTAGQVLTATSGTVATWQTPSVSGGDVVGPASATANGIALFNSTTGKLIKDSAASDGLIYGITVGRGAGAVSTNTAVGASALAANVGGQFNTVFGYEAGKANTADNNTFVGRAAGTATTSGEGNVAVGSIPLFVNTTGSFNVAIGNEANRLNTTGSSNTSVGYQSLRSNTTAPYNTAVGFQAAYSNTTGRVDAFGAQTLYSNTTGVANTAVGGSYVDNIRPALYGNTTGSYNVAIGQAALAYNTTASNNTAVGYQAGYSNTTGTRNTFLGYIAGYGTTTASANVAIGDNSLYSKTSTGNDCVVIGTYAGYYMTSGSANTFIGGSSGQEVTTGSKNTILGRFSGNQGGLDIRTASNYIVLSDGDGNPLVSTANSQTVALKGAVPNSGTGITFPATQSASSDANTLDDYEEGSWTPTLTDGYTRTYNQRNGRYIKIGKQVYVFGQLQGSTRTGSAGSYAYISLPFPANEMGALMQPATVSQKYNITTTSNYAIAAPQWDTPTEFRLYDGGSYISPSNIAADFQFGFFFVYLTNS